MKPVKLTMINIGPYKNATIDFTKLDNMFLIKGDTGSGKTFIFDAMTFALYGSLRGNRKGYESNFKSRYAKESDESFVEFTFEVANTIYKINRTVPFYYTKKNGERDKKPQEVSLEKLTGEQFHALDGKLNEINKKIETIIGLKADEFAQIVVLPQGEFAKFLHQNTNERMKTLEKLFPVEFYSAITERINERTKAEEQKLQECTNLIESFSKGKDFSNADNKIKNMNDEIDELKKNEETLIKKTTELAKKTEALKHAYRDAEEGEKNYQKLEQLKSQKNYFEKLSYTISNAERAKNLREFIAKYDTAKKHLEVAKNKFENSSKEKINFIEKFSTLENQKDEMQKLKTQNENDERELKNLFEKIKKCEELNKLKIENDSVQKEKQTNEDKINKLLEQKKSLETFLEGKTIAEIINEVSQSIQKFTEEKNKLATEKDDCKKRDDFTQKLEETNNLLNEAEENYTREQKKLERLQQTLKQNEACEFSLSLKDGEPCPVCGSLSHPHPAHKDAKLLNYSEQIITTKESIDSVQKLAQKYHDDCVAFQKEKKLCEENLAAISTKKSFGEIENAYNNTIEKIIQNENKNKQILQVNNELQKLEKHINETNELFEKRNRLYAENLGRIQEIEKTLGSPPETLQEKESNLRLQLEKNRDTFTRWETNYNETKTNLARAEESFSKDEQNVESWKNQFDEASRELNEKISFLNFNSIEEAKSFDLEDAELEKKRKEQNQFNEELKSAEDAVNVWKNKKLKSMEQITSELEETNKQEDALTNERDKVRNILNQKQAALTEYESDFKRFCNEQNKKITLEKELAPLRELNSNLSGNNKQKLQLESWALGMYFEQVVDFASRRFNDISNGRFFFKLKPTEDAPSGNKFRGLDLLVLDTHTGKTSDTAELSGGETFEASISLALAITDVVQNNNGGGIQLDSLFIDEGFGTLDSETLDKAMTVLTELAETKMIGMISHVSEMENYTGINSSIIVNKNTSGSTITIS